MPRPNRGASLRFIARRGIYYIVWYERGAERLRSTGTADEQMAQQALLDYRGDGVLPDTLSYRNAKQFIYFIGGGIGAIKIGLTTDLTKRLRTLQCGSPIALSVLALVPGSREIEAEYHKRFAAHRLHSEWFERCPEIEAEIERLNISPAKERKG